MSLAPALDDVAASPRPAAFTQYATGYSIRTPRYRYTEWGPGGRDGAELYDHTNDAAEMVNLAARSDRRKTIAELSRLLRVRIARARQPPAGVRQITAAGR